MAGKGGGGPMGGYGKFFFGGLLGALFGFLVSPKRAQNVREALLGGARQQMGQASTRLLEPPTPQPEPFDWGEAVPTIVEPPAEVEAELESAPVAAEEASAEPVTWEVVAYEGLREEPIEVPEYEPQRPADTPEEMSAQTPSDKESDAGEPEPPEAATAVAVSYTHL